MELNPYIDGAAFIPLVRTAIVPPTSDQIAAFVTATIKDKPYLTYSAARAMVIEGFAEDAAKECWASIQYTVLVKRDCAVGGGCPPMDWLSIRRDDRAPVRDWRHMMAIKDQLCGTDREGVELYPAHSRLVDQANQYHLWVFRDPNMKFPFGMNNGRHVSDTTPDTSGAVQRSGAGA